MLLRATRRDWIAGVAAGALAGAQTESLRLGRRIRIGIIGTEGHTSEITGPLRQVPDAELVAWAAPDAPTNLPGVKIYSDYRDMLDRERLDVAGVCNSNGERAAAVLACLERGLHVAAEKPLATERADLERIRQVLGRGKSRLTMLLPMRFEPVYAAMHSIVQSGEIGEVAQITAQKSYKRGDRPAWFRKHSTYGGTIPWIGTHMVDLMRWTSGREFVEAASFQTRIGFPELGDMENVTGSLFRLDNGGVALLNMDFLRPGTAPGHGDDRLRLAGTKGVVEYQGPTGLTLMTASRALEKVEQLPREQSLFLDFLASVYLGRPPGLSLADIFRVNEIVLLAREAAERHRFVSL